MTDFENDIKETIAALGQDKIACLEQLFENLEGQPPEVKRKRYRADHPEQIANLEYLEQSAHLIDADKKDESYRLRPYALLLLNNEKAKRLVKEMAELYGKIWKYN